MSWAVGEIRCSTDKGWQVVAGWRRELFGLDFRPVWFPDDVDPDGQMAWLLTHLPTGFGMMGLVMGLAGAQAVADEVAGWADWQHIDPLSARFLKPRVDALRERLDPRVLHPANLVPPWAETVFEEGPKGCHLKVVP
ncbi:MAG TPA: hypothetical protein VN231_05980 [Allosphingosinicella sp.]|nr:hypothetical protein [Allosphingosinicella sp.]